MDDNNEVKNNYDLTEKIMILIITRNVMYIIYIYPPPPTFYTILRKTKPKT